MENPSTPFVSIVMPVRNEAGFIARSLGAVLAQDYPADRLEVIVADGQSDDGTRSALDALARRNTNVHVLDNPGRIVATGLNRAFAVAQGDIIVRVDGHCEIAPDYVRRCVAHLQSGSADGVGGPLTTIGETETARTIAAAMSSKYGVGGSAFRTTSDTTRLTDTVAFPAYTRRIMEQAGPYDEEMVRNQDDEYNYRLRKLGARILLAADVRARYYSRSSLSSLARQYFGYGYWKVRVMQKHRRQMQVRQFVPPTFVAALIGGGALAFVPVVRWALSGVLIAYAVATSIAAVSESGRVGWRQVPMLALCFAVLHMSYGLGFLAGLVRFRGRWRDRGAVAPLGNAKVKGVELG
jgi:succinoglycan biosynthesis protein ExoA